MKSSQTYKEVLETWKKWGGPSMFFSPLSAEISLHRTPLQSVISLEQCSVMKLFTHW